MKLIKTLVVLMVVCFHFGTYAQVNQNSPVVVDRNNEVMFKLEDMKGNYTGFWTMNDGKGNMAIKLGIDGNGKYVLSNDGAAEILWGSHSQDGFISLNAARKGTALNNVSYKISLIVDSKNQAIRVGSPNNDTGGTSNTGHIIANSAGDLITNKLTSRSGTDLDIDLGNNNKLNVNGTVRSKEIVCETSNWPDYVFEENYDLKSLAEIEDFIQTEGHLPNIPSAEEVAEDGIALAKMNALLLEKIEELTLHMIRLEKEQAQEVSALKDMIEQLKSAQ